MTQANQQLVFFSANHYEKKVPAKRVSIFNLKLVRESTILFTSVYVAKSYGTFLRMPIRSTSL